MLKGEVNKATSFTLMHCVMRTHCMMLTLWCQRGLWSLSSTA